MGTAQPDAVLQPPLDLSSSSSQAWELGEPRNVHVENVGRGAAAGTFVRLKVLPGQTPNSIQKVGSWTERRLDVVGSGWDLAFAHPADELLYPGESRIAGVYRQTAEERTITVRVDCANAPPVEVTRKVKLELNKTEWFPAPEISPST
jgi:hypothetical protein